MRNRSRRGGRSGAPPLKMPRPGRAAAYALAFLLSAGALAIWGPKVVRDVGRDSIRTWLLPVAALAFLYLFARFLLARRAAHAGAIEIAAADPGGQADQIAADLREALISVRLSSSSPVPGESAPQDFVSDVRTAATTAQGWALFVAIATTFVPRNAYRVSLAVRADDASGPKAKGLTVEVRSRLSKEMSAETIWGESWQVVVDRAACHITAHVLPRTQLSRKPPWTPWRGIELNADLFRHFQEGRRLSKAGRLEEALEHLDRAIDMDPLNPYIRLEKAQILEQLRLYIDALAIYVDVVTLESWYDRRLWTRFRRFFDDDLGEPPPRRFARSPNGPAALQLAHYRLICSLAASDRLADQWSRHRKDYKQQLGGARVEQPRRLAEAVRVISRMRHLLPAYGKAMLASHGFPTEPSASDIEKDQRLLRRVFQYAALHEGLELERAYRWWRRCLHRWPGLPVSQSAIRLIPVWATLQYRFVVKVQERMENPPDLLANLSPISTRETALVRLALGWYGGSWPADATAVQNLVRRAVGRHSGWLERYNAACVFAVGMLTPELYKENVIAFPLDAKQSENHTKLSRLAVDQLTQAVVAADSQFAAGRAPWLRRGDQDLDDVRVTELYQTFIDRYLPEAARPPALPANLALLTMTGHFVNLVEGVAGLRSAYWQGRVRRGTPVRASDLHDEASWWERLREFCDDCRDASTRGRLITQAASLADLDPGSDGFDRSMPGIETDLRWAAEATKVIRRHGGDQSARIERGLHVSIDLRQAAESLRTERNGAMDRLGTALKRCISDDRTLDMVLADTQLPNPTSYASNSIGNDLSGAWTGIKDWMSALRDDRPEDGARSTEEAANQSMAAIANLQTRAVEGWPNFRTPEPPRV